MRIDERDIMFSRMSRQPGTAAYEEYYTRHPEHKEFDDALRALPGMTEAGKTMYDPINSPIIDATFQFVSELRSFVEGPPIAFVKTEASAETFTARIKGLATHYGAVLCGIAPINPEYYYSNRGRRDENYGDHVTPTHPFTIVFAVEMDRELINTAPRLTQSLASTKGYVEGAVIGSILTYYIKSLGYEARNHMDGNYLAVMPLAARAAGLGDIGRHGLLINPTYGSRLRLGAVTTDLPLITDSPSNFNVEPFCLICEKCVRTCHAQAIPSGEPKEIHGIKRWQINQEQCFAKWLTLGTDCGICIATCPFSSNLPVELVEAYIQDPTQAEVLLKDHESRYPIRPFQKEIPAWFK